MNQNYEYEEYSMDGNQRKNSHSKTFLSRQIFVQQDRKKRRLHTNSILNELRLNQKINQDFIFLKQEEKLKKNQSETKNSYRIKNRKRLSQINMNMEQKNGSNRMSNFCEKEYKNQQIFSKFGQVNTQNCNANERSQINNKNSSRIFVLKDIKKKEKKENKENKKQKNVVLSSIKNKIREINLISKTFDRVNQCFCIQRDNKDQRYNHEQSQAEKIIKNFESKLATRKNLITERKNSLKKNTKLQFRYKVVPKRFHTEAQQKQIQSKGETQFFIQNSNKYKGIWFEDARKFKNYLLGGYADDREQYSEFYDLEQYRKLKKNFQTFQQIYNSIKQDKQNPIGKVINKQYKNPNILQVVSCIQKEQQLEIRDK